MTKIQLDLDDATDQKVEMMKAFHRMNTKQDAAKRMINDADEPYNGWANRETWAMVLHLDNTRSWYDEAIRICRSVQKDYEKMDALKDFVDSLIEEESHDVFLLLQDVGSLWRIEWKDVVRHYKED